MSWTFYMVGSLKLIYSHKGFTDPVLFSTEPKQYSCIFLVWMCQLIEQFLFFFSFWLSKMYPSWCSLWVCIFYHVVSTRSSVSLRKFYSQFAHCLKKTQAMGSDVSSILIVFVSDGDPSFFAAGVFLPNLKPGILNYCATWQIGIGQKIKKRLSSDQWYMMVHGSFSSKHVIQKPSVAKEGAGVSTQFAVKSADRKGLVSRNACF